MAENATLLAKKIFYISFCLVFFFYKIGLSAARQYEMQRANSAPGQQ